MKIDTSSPMSFLKTMRLGHYEIPIDFFLDMHEQLDLLNCEKLALQSQLKQKDEELKEARELIEEMCVDDCGIDLAKEDRESLEAIIMGNDEKCQKWLEKHKVAGR